MGVGRRRRTVEFSALLAELGIIRCVGVRAETVLATLSWLREHPGPAYNLLGIAYGADQQWAIRAKRGRRILDQPDEQSARLAAQRLADRLGREIYLYARPRPEPYRVVGKVSENLGSRHQNSATSLLDSEPDLSIPPGSKDRRQQTQQSASSGIASPRRRAASIQPRDGQGCSWS